jgi:hypothetical protein
LFDFLARGEANGMPLNYLLGDGLGVDLGVDRTLP